MMPSGELWYQEPAVVEVAYHDGRREDLAFGSRLEAEQWVGLIPALQLADDPDARGIREAVLRRAAVGLN